MKLRDEKIGRLLEALGFVMVDIGARHGFDREIAGLAWCTDAIGFEPDPEEAQRLAEQAHTEWRSARSLPFAVGGEDGEATLYIPDSPASASLLPHNQELVARFGYDNMHISRREFPVRTRTLDSLFAGGELPRVDYLKIDIEGAELAVLQSARAVLSGCLAIKVECSFLEQRIKQPLIWEVASYLSGEGFEIVDLADIRRWRRKSLALHPYMARSAIPYSRGQLAQCDVIALRRVDTLKDTEQRIRLVCLAAALSYFDHAVFLVQNHSDVSAFAREGFGVEMEAALGQWSRRAGKAAVMGAMADAVRDLVPLTRSMFRTR